MELGVVPNPSLDMLATATKETCCESVMAGQMNRTVLTASLYFVYMLCTQFAAAIQLRMCIFTALLSRAQYRFLPRFRYPCAQNSVLNPTVLESFYWTVALDIYEREQQARLAGYFEH